MARPLSSSTVVIQVPESIWGFVSPQDELRVTHPPTLAFISAGLSEARIALSGR